MVTMSTVKLCGWFENTNNSFSVISKTTNLVTHHMKMKTSKSATVSMKICAVCIHTYLLWLYDELLMKISCERDPCEIATAFVHIFSLFYDSLQIWMRLVLVYKNYHHHKNYVSFDCNWEWDFKWAVIREWVEFIVFFMRLILFCVVACLTRLWRTVKKTTRTRRTAGEWEWV